MNGLWQVLRAKMLVMAMMVMTDKTATLTAQLAAAVLTQRESMKCWLELVSICIKVKEHKIITY